MSVTLKKLKVLSEIRDDNLIWYLQNLMWHLLDKYNNIYIILWGEMTDIIYFIL